MDIITHIALGAVTGELILGNKIGKKALFWGAIGGILPDIDLLFYPFLEPSKALLIHRGFTHSFLYLILLSPLVGWFLSLLYKNITTVKPKHWALLILLQGILHITLDLFTSYGTSIFLPFNKARYAFSTIASFDFLFTLPLLLVMMWLIFSKYESKTRLMITWLAISVSSLYLFYTVINKAHENGVFEQALLQQKKPYFQLKAYPQLFSNFNWLCIAKTHDGYWVGYNNQLHSDSIRFQFVSKNDYWLIDYESNPKIQRLKRFAKNEYTISHNTKGEIVFCFLRYGWEGNSVDANPMFSYTIIPNGTDVDVVLNDRHFLHKNR